MTELLQQMVENSRSGCFMGSLRTMFGSRTDESPMQAVTDKKISYRRDIDGLRALAVLSVMAFHLSPARFRGGFVGVDIFFVISGFLISSIIYQDLRSGSFSIVTFYVRRVRRIYPALFIVLCFVSIAGWIILLPSEFVVLGKQILGGSTFIANFVLWWQSGYFSPEASLKPLLHFWSLGVEEQFYLIFPLICRVLYRPYSRRPLVKAFLGIALLSMLANVASVSRFPAAAYFLPFSRLWELLAGAGVSLWMGNEVQGEWDGRNISKWRHGMGILGLALLVTSFFAIDQFDSFPGWWALLPTAGTCLLIIAGERSWVNHRILSYGPFVFLGLISYPLYLWHWPILSFLRISTFTWGIKISHLLKGTAMLSALPLAYLTYRYVELPIRRVRDEKRRRKGALYLVGCVAITGAFGFLVIVMKGFPARMPGAIVALDHDYGSISSNSWREGTCFLRIDQSATAFADTCVDKSDGSGDRRPLLLIWGDSHAADLYPGFRAMQNQSNVRLAQYTSSMCAPIIGVPIRERPACMGVNAAILDRIRILKPDIVVLSAYWDYPDPDHDRQTRNAKLLQTIELLKLAGIRRVVLLGSAPYWTAPVPGLLAGELRHDPSRPVPHRLRRELLQAYNDTLLYAIALKGGAVYVPILENLCDLTSCPVTTGPGWEDLLTYDQSHFTDHGSMLLAQRIWSSVIGPRS